MITRFHLIAKIIFNILGVYSLILCLTLFADQSYIPRVYGDSGFVYLLGGMRTIIIFKVILLFVSFNIFFLRNKWILKMAGPSGQDGKPIGDVSILAGLRLSFVFCGLVIIAYNMDYIVQAVVCVVTSPKILVDMLIYKYVHRMFDISFNAYLLHFVRSCIIALGIYLIIGAPRFVNWQIKKLKQALIEKEENYTSL